MEIKKSRIEMRRLLRTLNSGSVTPKENEFIYPNIFSVDLVVMA